MPRAARALPFVLAGIAAVGLAAASAFRHDHFGSNAYDLGLYDQTIWGYGRLELLPNTVVRLPNLLGDHFHPILIALAPLYWVWSDPRVLLLAQAAALALSRYATSDRMPQSTPASRRSRPTLPSRRRARLYRTSRTGGRSTSSTGGRCRRRSSSQSTCRPGCTRSRCGTLDS